MSESTTAWGRRLSIMALIGALTTPATPAIAGAQQEQKPMNGHPVVETDAGPVRGTLTAEHRTFQGIPYAAAPVGSLRWRAPQPVTPWTGPKDATGPGSPCPQLPSSYTDVTSVKTLAAVLPSRSWCGSTATGRSGPDTTSTPTG
jgi:hypothetical protein